MQKHFSYMNIHAFPAPKRLGAIASRCRSATALPYLCNMAVLRQITTTPSSHRVTPSPRLNATVLQRQFTTTLPSETVTASSRRCVRKSNSTLLVRKFQKKIKRNKSWKKRTRKKIQERESCLDAVSKCGEWFQCRGEKMISGAFDSVFF